MTAIRILGFTGEIPRLIPRLLPDAAAQSAFDTRMENGDLRPLRESKNRYANGALPSAAPATIYRFMDTWLYWASRVNAAPGPVADDRLYYTGSGAPKMYVGGTHYAMKIVAPSSALAASLSGTGSGDTATRLYCYTNVSQFGEESEPSPLTSAVTWQEETTAAVSAVSVANPSVLTATAHGFVSGQSVSLTGFGTTPSINGTYTITVINDNSFSIPVNVTAVSDGVGTATALRPVTLTGFSTSMGDRTATYQRIYRSQTSLSGDTSLYFIAERAAGTGSFVDTVPVSDIQELLPSLTWNQPPDTLSGLISLPNGMMAAFSGKDLYFCEPYQPQAWPQGYILTTDYDIVALGAYGTTVVVMTSGYPYIAQGTAPENMIMERLELSLPCINAAGVVDLGYAVAYPSYDGLVVASGSGARLATEGLFGKDEWRRINPAALIASQYNGRYVASYSYTDSLGETVSGMVIIDLSGSQQFITRSTEHPIAFFFDITTGELFYLNDQIIWEFDAVGLSWKTQNWKSKEFVFTRPERMCALLVETEQDRTSEENQAILAQIQEVLAANAILYAGVSIGGELNGAGINQYAVNDDSLELPPTGDAGFVSASVYADGVLVATVSVTDRMVRLPSVKARRWEIEITSNIAVTQITMAKSGLELKAV